MQEHALAVASSLLTAAQQNDWDTVSELFPQLALLPEHDAECQALLYLAASSGQTNFLQQHCALLQEKWVNPKTPDGYTPLFHAIKAGHKETVMMLLQCGARLDCLNINGDNPIHYAMRCGRTELAEELTQQLLIQLEFNQRAEAPALLHAFTTIYAYHHRVTAKAFFEQAQKSHQATEQQTGLEEKREAIKPLTNQELERRFQSHQFRQAQEELYPLLKTLEPTDLLIPLILWAWSESHLQYQTQEGNYEQAMGYASSAVMHYQKLVPDGVKQAQPQATRLYQSLLFSQQQRIIITYRQLILGPVDDPGDLHLEDYRQALFQHREKLKGTLKKSLASASWGQEIRHLLQTNTDFFVDLTRRLWMQSLALSQKQPPCAYAVLSLGSMSKTEMCPYSDLEFALLIEKDDPKVREFFLPLVRLVHLLVIGLGETPLQISTQVQFSPTATGYHFDDGGNTPLYANFMATPEALAAIQRTSNPGMTIARNVLRATGFIVGDESLHQTYQDLLDKALSEKPTATRPSRFNFSSKGMTRAQLQALDILEGALPEFAPSSLTAQDRLGELHLLNIKRELYRLPSQVIDSLSLYYGVAGNTTFEKLKNLAQKKTINRQTALKLMEALETAEKYRIKTHLYYGTEEESVVYQAPKSKRVLPHEKPVYVLKEPEREELLGLYQILLPLEFAVREFVVSKGKNNPFKHTLTSQEEFAKKPALQHHLAARSYEKLFSPEKALGSYHQALRLDPDNVEIHLHYVSYVHSLQQMHERNRAGHETTAIAYARTLSAHLLNLQAQQLLSISGFNLYYEALPLTWHAAFQSDLHVDNPVHRRLIENLDRFDQLPKQELDSTHQESKACIAKQAQKILTRLSQAVDAQEVKAADGDSAVKASPSVELAQLTAILKKPDTHSSEEHAILLTYSFSLLGQLIQADIAKIEKYQRDDIDKSIAQMVRVLLMPDKKGARNSEAVLTIYRQLPFGLRVPFRQALLHYQEQLAQAGRQTQQTLKQREADLAFFTALLKTLNEEPDEAGQRESWQVHKQDWQNTLRELVEVGTKNPNRVNLVSSLFDPDSQQAISYPLKPEIEKALLDESFEFRSNKINGSEHRVVRVSLRQVDGTSKTLYCKACPEMPGMTYLIERLHHRLINHGTCLSELVKLERPGKPPIPVLISEGIPGLTLHEVLKKSSCPSTVVIPANAGTHPHDGSQPMDGSPHSRGRQVSERVVTKRDPQHLQHLDHQAYSDLVLLAILTNPEDGLPTNYIVTPKEAGKEPLTLVSIDHDHALFPPYLLEPVKPASAESKQADADGEDEAEEEKQSLRPKLQIKTILFCLDAMHKPVDAQARDALLRLKPAKVIASVLREAQVQNDYYSQLFDPQTIQAFHENRATKAGFFRKGAKNTAENCTMPIPIKEGDAIKLYQKLHRLQQFLTEYPEATLLQCLLHIEPRVGVAYTRALQDYPDPLQRLFHLGEYPVNLQGQMVTSTQAIKSLRIQTQQIGAEHYVDLKDLTPAQGLAELDLMTYQQDTLARIREEVMRGDFRRFLSLKAPEHKAEVIESIDWYKFADGQQRVLLTVLNDIPFTHLNLSGCTVITQKQLTQLLVQSPNCTVLDLSDHPTLDDLWLSTISRNARYLKELTIRRAPNLEHIRNTSSFRHLTLLDVAENLALQTVNIKAPQLKLLQAKNCPKLHTLKTASQQLREVDVSNNKNLQFTQGIGHPDSGSTLHQVKLSGCTQIEVGTLEAWSAYPVLLLAFFLSETGHTQAIALLDRYVGRKVWVLLLPTQRKEIVLRLISCQPEYCLDYGFALIRQANYGKYQKAAHQTLATYASCSNLSSVQAQAILDRVTRVESSSVHVEAAAHQTLVVYASRSDLTSAQVQALLDGALAGVKGREDYVRSAAQCALMGCASHSDLSSLQVQAILDGILAGVKDRGYYIRCTAHRALKTYVTRSDLSSQQMQSLLDTALAGVKDKNSDVRKAAQQALTAYVSRSDLTSAQVQALLDRALRWVKDGGWEVQEAAQLALAAYAFRSDLASAQVQALLDAALEVKDKEGENVRKAAYQVLAGYASRCDLSSVQVQALLEGTLAGVKDPSWEVQQAAYRALQACISRSDLSSLQVQALLDGALGGMKDMEWYGLSTAQQALAAYASRSDLSFAQMQALLDAVWVGLKDQHSSNVHKAAQQVLAIYASRSDLSSPQVQSLLDRALGRVKDWGKRDRIAAHLALVAYASRSDLSSQQLQSLLDATLVGVKDKDISVRAAVQQALAVYASRSDLSSLQVQALLDAALVGAKDQDEHSAVREAAQQALVALISRSDLTSAQVQTILDGALTGLQIWYMDVSQDARQTAQNVLIQYAQRASWEQLLPYLLLLKDKKTDIQTQLGIASILPTVQQRFSLETYLSQLQLEEKLKEKDFISVAAKWVGIHAKMETQLEEIYLPHELRRHIKIYEKAIQESARNSASCQAAMEVVVAPEFKANQQQFAEQHTVMFERYQSMEQARIVAFQHQLMDPQPLTEKTFTTVQTQFSKEQSEAKVAFQVEMQAFYQQSSDQLNGETKRDVSELVQKRRAFLDAQWEQTETQARARQTLFIQWHQALQTEAHLLREPQEFKNEIPTSKKSLSPPNEQTTQLQQLQQTLQTLRAKLDSHHSSQSPEHPEHTQLTHRCERLLKEGQQAQQMLETVIQLQTQPALSAFYGCIKNQLSEYFLVSQMVIRGILPPNVTIATQLPYAAFINAGLFKGVQPGEGALPANDASALPRSLIEMHQLAEKIARLLTWRYEAQIQKLTRESAIVLGETAVAYMMAGLRHKGTLDPHKSLAEQMTQAMYEIPESPHIPESQLKTHTGQTNWTAASVLFKAGIALWDKESLTFSFYAQKPPKNPAKKPPHDLCNNPEKYGYRLGSMQEVMRLDLRKRPEVPVDTSAAFTNSIGLHSMDVPTKQRKMRMDAPALLPSLPQEAEATPADEEKALGAVPVVSSSSVGVNVERDHDGGSVAIAVTTAPLKNKKQVRFSENIHIILPKPRSSQQDDSPRTSPSHSLLGAEL